MAHDVFISHSSQDKTIADAVCAALEKEGIRCWIAPRDVQPGRSFAGEITRAIQHSRVMTLIFSEHSNASEQVLREVQLAANSHLHIVQFRIQDVLPNDDLEYYLSTPHWLDAMTPPLENHLDRLVISIKALLALPHAPGPPREEFQTGQTMASPPPPPLPAFATSGTAPPSLPRGQTMRPLFQKRRAWWIAGVILFLGFALAILLLATWAARTHSKVAGNTGVAPTLAAPSSPIEKHKSAPSPDGRNPSFTFVNMEKAYKEFHKTKQVEAQDQARARDEIIKEVKAKIDQSGGSKVDLVIDSSSMSLNGVPFFVFWPTAADSTNQIVAGLNNNAKGTLVSMRPFPVAVVDMNQIFKRYSKTKDAEAKINEAKSAAKKEYDTRAAAYKNKLTFINSRQMGPLRDRAIVELKAMEKEINEFRSAREKELRDQALQLRDGLVKEIDDFMSANFVKGQECIILDASGATLSGIHWVIFSQGVPDLTEDMISGMNSGPVAAANPTFASSEKLRFAQVALDRVFVAMPERQSIEAEIQAEKDKAKAEFAQHPDAAAQAAKDKEIEASAQKKRQPIIDKVTTAVSGVGATHHFNLIINSAGRGWTGTWVVLKIHQIPDLTDEVVAQLKTTR